METLNEHGYSRVEWALRLAMFAAFLANGIQAALRSQDFIDIVTSVTGMSASAASTAVFLIGILDIIVAFFALFKPLRIILIWASIWVLVAATAEVVSGGWGWDALERMAHVLVPYALLFLRGWPKNLKEWFS